jgi:hypothetical protein
VQWTWSSTPARDARGNRWTDVLLPGSSWTVHRYGISRHFAVNGLVRLLDGVVIDL